LPQANAKRGGTFQKRAIMQTTTLFSVPQFSAKHPGFKTGGLRALIFNEHSNGLAKSGAIVRIGRKVLIDETKFFAWVESQNGGAK
jgi:hypothetical protein